MAYPGNPELSAQAQERVIAAFRQVINKLQEGQRAEALIGLEFVLRLDPSFTPASNLHKQLSAGDTEVDLASVIGGLQAPSTDAINELLVEAVEAFNNRDFLEAEEKVKTVLRELPGHQEARELFTQVENALKVETQVGQFLTQAREALDGGDPQEAANFVMMAQALDPHFSGIDGMLQEISAIGEGQGAASPAAPPSQPPAGAPPESPAADDQVGFETVAFDASGFDVQFDDAEGAGAEPAAAAVEVAPPEDSQEPVYSFEADEAVAEGSDQAEAGFFEPEPPASAGEAADDDGAFVFDTEGQTAEPEAEPPPAAAEESFAFGVDDQPPPAAAAPREEVGLFDAESSDVADLFDADAVEEGLFDKDFVPSEDDASGIDALLGEGQEAFDRGSFQEAADLWSKIYAIDPSHEEASRRIDEARTRIQETETRIETMLADAHEAEDGGDTAKATELVQAVLSIHPDHPEAVKLRNRLEPGAAPESATIPDLPPLPDPEDELFADDTGPGLGQLTEPLPDISLEIPDREQAKAPTPAKRGLPWRLLIVAAAALVVILAGAWIGTRFLSSSKQDRQAEALTRVIEQAEALFRQRQIEEAIHLLQEFNASDLDRERIQHRIAKYRKALAPPTPTPIPDSLLEAEKLFESGQWMAAYEKASAGLDAHPQDLGLVDLKQRILDVEPQIATLHTSLSRSDFRTAAGLAEGLVNSHPGQEEFAFQLRRSLYNAALGDLRTYKLSASEAYLLRLAEIEPNDADVRRILKFIGRYKAKPVDMQLEIFIKSLEAR